MKTPFVKIYINGDPKQDISEDVSEFDYETSLEKDDMVEIKINPDRAISLLDDKNIIESKTYITSQFGYLGFDISQIVNCKVVDIDGTYSAKKLSLIIRGLDKGNQMKKATRRRTWINKTSTQIAQEIATNHGLTLEKEDTAHVWPSLPQAGISDFDFLQKLANMEQNGSYVFYVGSDTMYFVKEKLDELSVITYTFGSDERLISFKPKYRESTGKKSNIKSVFSSLNPLTKKLDQISTDNSNKKDNTLLGKYSLNFDVMGKQVGRVLNNIPTAVEGAGKDATIADKAGAAASQVKTNIQELLTDPVSEFEAGNITNKKTKKKRILMATLVVELNPSLRTNKIITMAGVAKRHSGNWFVWGIKHTIKGGHIATTTLELSKNAYVAPNKNSSLSVLTDKVNTTVGKTENKTTVTVKKIQYDNNGNELK